jgi:hypothetical protein
MLKKKYEKNVISQEACPPSMLNLVVICVSLMAVSCHRELNHDKKHSKQTLRVVATDPATDYYWTPDVTL